MIVTPWSLCGQCLAVLDLEETSLLSLYLLIGKGVLDLVPIIHRIITGVRDWMKQPHTTKATHEDLAHRLLEAVQDDTHLQLKDHRIAFCNE